MSKTKIAVIGLGYVGLPLAQLLATKYGVIGFDINDKRISELKKGNDHTLEVEEEMLNVVLSPTPKMKKGLFCTNNVDHIKECHFYIITVPTPVDKANKPVLTALLNASKTVGAALNKGAIVIYESTVYPGATEEECVPVLEKASGLGYNQDFFVGYSPERINPGDKKHTIDKILKVTSGSTLETAKKVDSLYSSVITAGTYLAPSIKVAEAAKVIENSQRDINIAFVNELAKIFGLMNIDTHEVLKAAGTKWNFLPFTPGLVGGHCIGVDPYYLAQKAQAYGYHPEVILAGRRMNDSMGQYVSAELIKLMVTKNIKIKGAHILVMGITFKENCPDVRNTKVVDVIENLKSFSTKVSVYDPWAAPKEVAEEYGFTSLQELPGGETYDAIVLTVAHSEFKSISYDKLLKSTSVLYDVKGILDQAVDGRL